MKQKAFVTILGVSLAVVAISIPLYARADGAPIPPYGYSADITMPGQKAIIVYNAEEQRQDLIISVQLLGEVPEAAWVVPVPSPPEVNTASAEWFEQLSDLTQPEVRIQRRMLGSCGATLGAEQGRPAVELLSREQVGVYDVSVLASSDPTALLEWLDENGYAFPEKGTPIMEAYIEDDWYFIATRVLPGETAHLENDVQPLWLSFETDAPVYPMRLTALVENELDMLIYVLSDHRVEIQDFEYTFDTEFAGPLTLDPIPADTSQLNALLTEQEYYVTKLRSPYFYAWEVSQDFYFKRADTDETYRRVIYQTEYVPCCCPLMALAVPLLALTAKLTRER